MTDFVRGSSHRYHVRLEDDARNAGSGERRGPDVTDVADRLKKKA